MTANETIASVANSTVSALRSTPTLLLLILLNCIFLAVGGFYLTNQQKHVMSLVHKVFDECLARNKS
jgi:ABC-type amino acid transport system permease subunit